MWRLIGSTTLVLLGILVTGSPAIGQKPPNPREPRSQQHNQPPNPSHGVDSGQATIKLLSGQGKKAGMIDIQTAPGRHLTVSFGDDVPIDVEHTQLSGQKARPFLVSGVKVRVSWTDARDPRYVTGRWADKITILTEEIEGTVTSISDRVANVVGAPKKSSRMDREEPPPLHVNGRQQPKAPTKKPPIEVKPRKLRLSFKPQATSFTLDGKECKQTDLLASAKGRSDLAFEAILLSGSGNVVVELYVHSDAGRAPDKNLPPAQLSK